MYGNHSRIHYGLNSNLSLIEAKEEQLFDFLSLITLSVLFY